MNFDLSKIEDILYNIIKVADCMPIVEIALVLVMGLLPVYGYKDTEISVLIYEKTEKKGVNI